MRPARSNARRTVFAAQPAMEAQVSFTAAGSRSLAAHGVTYAYSESPAVANGGTSARWRKP